MNLTDGKGSESERWILASSAQEVVFETEGVCDSSRGLRCEKRKACGQNHRNTQLFHLPEPNFPVSHGLIRGPG